ncbi:MAG: Pantoate--beta-alanine ligase [uncultured Chloroflexi bacterium]|uniref:Pantothenate synthetase n=1 Tax=uncultured Chloroflexota bacterium TaxID=166587 RepID=A0A6J4K1Q5_9CHLR|nr:MAG: Pantoate--beta-alanine ligase [uncultured Chloroflexota bacterium]
MNVLNTVAEFRAARAGVPEPLGLVPTMGALHEGHISLARRARAECATVAMSVFVNPSQFGPREDLSRYPRPIERDLQMAREAGVDVVFHPSVEEMYPAGHSTWVEMEGPAKRWEGEHRPGHFRGVATVVAKLFTIIAPQREYFGEKDFQQLAVIRRLAADLMLPVDVIGCPTVREPDGLALSSRNVYLTPEERPLAVALHNALQAGRRRIGRGEREAETVRRVMEQVLLDTPGFTVDYVAVVDPGSLEPLKRIEGPARGLIAARIGSVRLIDNMSLAE